MEGHPFKDALVNKFSVIAAILTLAAILWGLVVIYGNLTLIESLFISIFFNSFIFTAGYFYWYIYEYIKAVQAKIVIIASTIVVSLIFVYAIHSLIYPEEYNKIFFDLPLFALYGLFILIYISNLFGKYKCENNIENNSKKNDDPNTDEKVIKLESIDRISVKEGSMMHIINVEDIVYIKAEGDYALLITENGKYIKELTMKYFETHLPDNFIRVHRSYIVNLHLIVRTELYGKENYYIYLKNNEKIRASSTGYKLLKQNLLM